MALEPGPGCGYFLGDLEKKGFSAPSPLISFSVIFFLPGQPLCLRDDHSLTAYFPEDSVSMTHR